MNTISPATTMVDRRRRYARRRSLAPMLMSAALLAGCSSDAPPANRPSGNADIVGKAKAATAVPGADPTPAPVEAGPAPTQAPPQAPPTAAKPPAAPAATTTIAPPKASADKASAGKPAAPKTPAPRATKPRKSLRATNPATESAPVITGIPTLAPAVKADAPEFVRIPAAPSRTAEATPILPLRPPMEERSPIYSHADSDVVPAKLLTPQKGGPTFRNVMPDINTMELVISKQGRVEQVKLVTPPKRMTDMLMLSGAKTWKFMPATRNGEPVRYRTEFSWEMNP